jgi:hypothetical protein
VGKYLIPCMLDAILFNSVYVTIYLHENEHK